MASVLEDPENVKRVAELLAEGATRKTVADTFNIKDLDTITRWKRDPRIKAKVRRLIDDRAIDVSRKVDSTIEGRLQRSEDLTIKELIEIRKEYGGTKLANKEVDDDALATQALELLEKDPELLDKLTELIEAQEQAKESDGHPEGATSY